MRKAFIILLITSMCLIPAAPVSALILTPIVDPETTNPSSEMYVPTFSLAEQDVFTKTAGAFNKTIAQLRQLEQKYPGMGFLQFSDQLQAKYYSYNGASKNKGWSVWGDTPAYISADNYLCFTDKFFSDRYSDEARMGIILHELAHLEQYRGYRFGSNLLNGITLGFISKPSETDSNIEEYKWLRILGIDRNSFEMQNVLKALVEQGVIPSVDATDNLDMRLGIQEIVRITAQGLETALNGEEKSLKDPIEIIPVTLIPGGFWSEKLGVLSYIELKTNSARVPAHAQANFAFTVPAPGTVTMTCEYSTNAPESAPRFSGDGLGYRKQAYMVVKIGNTSNTYSFNNSYAPYEKSILNIDKQHFQGGEQVQVTIVTQGVSAGISSVTGEMVPMPDGSGYIYYAGACKFSVSYIQDSTSGQQRFAPSVVPDVRVLIYGEDLVSDTPPTIVDGRTLVPMAAIFKSLGADVSWEGSTRTVTGIKGDMVIKLQIDSTTAWINNQSSELDVPATIINNRTMVPLSFIALSLGRSVQWDGEKRTVTIE